ncbi:Fe(3+) ABC transporter substrate-binding protein [Sulfuriroseicoccus oceanibius]|uniref:Fe(3+) ABC transporter substrate-binding protein n=1 Tax=Sulfuriroseicoccus oceanibius TaxID=2707525 RepID=A0A6B3LA00_9BACT|nr:Fe(3+) ABC transporter substrate-binding protein [Sulfuriroseicoccus oceanibius]QQL46106.1 Fe(3+) ABC transporter substrate-binding protein [Sulfuriroseicoccus oceanibius]
MKLRNLITTVLAATISVSAVSADEETVTVYSYRHYEGDQKLYEEFTRQTGIKVETVKAKADALIERIEAEGEKSPADIFIAADVGRLEKARELGILQSVTSEALESQVPAHLRDPEGHWYGFTVRARVIMYAKDRVDPASITSYQDLTKPEWKGRICVRSSSNIYNQSLLAGMIANHGKAKALQWAKGVRKNMARAPQGSDRDQMRAVAAGIADVAIANTYYYGLLASSPDEKDREVASKIGLIFPDQDGTGTHINISGGGVVKTSDNKEAAVKLLEFLSSAEAQKTFPTTTHEYPLNMDHTLSPALEPWAAFKYDPIDLKKVGASRKDAAKLFLLSGWE